MPGEVGPRPEIPLLINGEWCAPSGLDGEACYDPWTGQQTGWLRYAGAADVESAVAGAWKATVSRTGQAAAGDPGFLRALAERLTTNADELAEAITTETGQTWAAARAETDRARELLEDLRSGSEGSLQGSPPPRVHAAITLYNQPLLGPLATIVPALAVGDSVVWRPCTWSPRTATLLAELLVEAGVRPGALSVLHGGIAVVDALLDDPRVHDVTYLGSGPWARYMAERAGGRGARVRAMGALRRAHIVAAADWDAAALDNLAERIWIELAQTAGQSHLAGTLVIASPEMVNTVTGALASRSGLAQTGPALAMSTTLSPQIRPDRQRQTRQLYERFADDLTALPGDGVSCDGGFFVPLAIIGGDGAGRLAEEEFVAPALAVISSGQVSSGSLDLSQAGPFSVVPTVHEPAGSVPLGDEHLLARRGPSYFEAGTGPSTGAPVLFPPPARDAEFNRICWSGMR